MYRLFVAIDIPDDVKRKIADVTRDAPDGARRIPLGQLHLTLRFIGDTDQRLFNMVKEELAKVSADSLCLTVRGVGHFPPGRQPRVLWVGIDGGGELRALQARIEGALVTAGIEPEGRPFSPHITVARLRDTALDEIVRLEEKQRGFRTNPFAVREFFLYSSQLTREGAIHTKEASFPLHTP